MTNAQDAVAALQSQALEAIKSGQDAAVKAVQAWTEGARKLVPDLPQVPGVAAGVAQVGDPAAIVDSVYDFAAQLIELNKEFVHKLLAAAPAPAADPAAK